MKAKNFFNVQTAEANDFIGTLYDLRPRIQTLLWITYPLFILFVLALPSGAPFHDYLIQVFSLVFNILLLVIFTCLLHCAPGRLSRLLGLSGLFLFLALFLLVSIYHYCLYKQLLGLPSIYAMLDTDRNEAAEFIMAFGRIDYLGLSLLVALPLFCCAVYPSYVAHRRQHRWPVAIAICLCLLLGSMYWFVKRYSFPSVVAGNPIWYSIRSIRLADSERHRIAALSSQLFASKTFAVTATRKAPTTHILIIGEATTRRHMSLYGYGRNTTPLLQAARKDLYISTDDCSSRTQTIPALKELLTFATREAPSLLYKAPSLIQVMQKAGYQTYWISNQRSVGQDDTWASLLAKPAKKRFYENTQSYNEGLSLDARVLEPLRRVLTDQTPYRFIIIHLMGAHADYYMRYPAEFNIFKDASNIPAAIKNRWHRAKSLEMYNEYDNAIRYNDFIVSRILLAAKKLKRATVTYIPDHGEEVGDQNDDFGHVSESPYRATYEVPLIFWMSNMMKQELLSQNKDVFERNLTRPYQSDELKNTLLDLYQIKFNLYRPEGSLFSPHFQQKARHCDTVPD